MELFQSFVSDYGLFAIFILILIEYACFPVSSEIILPFSGALASYQNISFVFLLVISIVAGLLGTSFCYLIGRIGGNYLIQSFLKRFPKKEHSFHSSYSLFQSYGSLATCFGRLVPICRTYIAFIAGAYKQPFTIFFFSSAIGISFWNCILIGLGYYFHENWELVKGYYQDYKILFLLLLLLGLLYYCVHQYRKKKKCFPK